MNTQKIPANEFRKKVLQIHHDLSGGNTMRPVMRTSVAEKLGITDFNDLELLDVISYLEKHRYLEAYSNVEETITHDGVDEVDNKFPHFPQPSASSDDLRNKTEDELLAIQKDAAPNAYVPGSIYHRVRHELERRHRKNMEEAARKSSAPIAILSQGDNATFVGNTFEYRSVKTQNITANHKEDKATSSRPATEPLFTSKQPDIVGFLMWWMGLPNRINIFVARYIKKRVLRWFLILLVLVIVLLVITKVYFLVYGDSGHFSYKPDGLTYALESPQASTTLQVLFQGEVTNISPTARYLNNFVSIIWKNALWDNTWNYNYSTDIGEVYSVEGATDTPITLPISFAANETKTLQWRFKLDISDSNVTRILSEEQCDGVFCWNKGLLYILMVDSRGNLFDDKGNLQSQKVIDDWWVLPDYRNIKDKIPAELELVYDILVWKIKQFLPLPS